MVVILTRPEGYKKRPSGALMGKLRYRQYPHFVRALERRYLQYNDSLVNLRRLEEEGRALVIRPSRDLGVKRMEKDLRKVQAQYDLGREDALGNKKWGALQAGAPFSLINHSVHGRK